eukprot:1675892-Rhodomonas_salina.1
MMMATVMMRCASEAGPGIRVRVTRRVTSEHHGMQPSLPAAQSLRHHRHRPPPAGHWHDPDSDSESASEPVAAPGSNL